MKSNASHSDHIFRASFAHLAILAPQNMMHYDTKHGKFDIQDPEDAIIDYRVSNLGMLIKHRPFWGAGLQAGGKPHFRCDCAWPRSVHGEFNPTELLWRRGEALRNMLPVDFCGMIIRAANSRQIFCRFSISRGLAFLGMILAVHLSRFQSSLSCSHKTISFTISCQDFF